jgi:hypothetical protein
MIVFLKKWRDKSQQGYGPFGRLYREMETARFNAVKEQQLVKAGVARKWKKGKEKDVDAEQDQIEQK